VRACSVNAWVATAARRIPGLPRHVPASSLGPDLESGPEGQERDLESRFLLFGTFRDRRSLFSPFREGLQIPPEQRANASTLLQRPHSIVKTGRLC
jgi:hypothetical protein